MASIWLIGMIGLSMLIVWNSTEYFLSEYTPAFLVEKLPISLNAVWLAALRLHVIASSLGLAVGFPLFFTSLLKYRSLHLTLGYIYFNAVLWVAAPTGLILSPFSKGGVVAAIGFSVTGLIWWFSTWYGYVAVQQGNVPLHIRWMVRSFSIALSAVFFRVIHFALSWTHIDPEINYVASVWLSLLASLWLAEECIGTKWLSVRRPVVSSSRHESVFRSSRSSL
ncbi:MAG: DUF2306 domain-containing protein [Planctomycetota bacterium]|nr:DUF2306 domain-containing protein [Planctomycetota bacterium]MDA1178458.1 DUF2306 domain-containing protein [Planctomycetota bacterium]